ncbi:CKLF-like MARVEL transmembrane domain-containing protein 8 isoform X2 [Hyposmocoma kahamanoa]|uniref:CKLF-like MARVEL transmembrane domain-containing protein 8 isoform X2 n=1 Tax=Hyposmocoma kahamanoa TaxID=1477025 RepID=UPI000E6D82B5|nr:CKLF-like MARVEL transmembrane domain-containing protein 8 isoform X2 [Hyposmocoma kahamanoa]
MSHTVTITRTTTSNTGTAVLVNTGFLGSTPGLLKLAQLVLGAACTGLMGYYINSGYHGFTAPTLFYLISAVSCLMGTFCLFVACLFSLSSATFISKTNFEVIFHTVAFIFYLVASVLLIVEIHRYSYSTYNQYLAASIMGFVMAVLYAISTYFAYRTHKTI